MKLTRLAVFLPALFLAVVSFGADNKRIIGKIIAVNDKFMTIDRGSRDGVIPKMLFDVYLPARIIHVPLSRKKMLVKEEKLGRLIVIDVEDGTSRGEFLDTRNVRKLKVGLDVSNVPEMLSENVNAPPVIKSFSADPSGPVSCGIKVTVKLVVFDVDDDYHNFHWEVTGGALMSTATTVPVNTWQAPAGPGKHTLKVSVTDNSGGCVKGAITLTSAGVKQERYPLVVKDILGASSGRFSKVADMAFDRMGHIYILDGENREVVKLDESFAVLDHTTAWPSGAYFTRLAARSGKIYLLDKYYEKIRTYDFPDKVGKSVFQKAELLAAFGGRGASNGYFTDAVDLVVSSEGNILILDGANPSVHVYNPFGEFVASTGKKGAGKSCFSKPVAMAMDESGRLYVLDRTRKTVLVFKDLCFTYEFQVGGNGAGDPVDIAFNAASNQVLVLDAGQKQVLSFSPDGKTPGPVFGKTGPEIERLKLPERLFADYNGNVYVVESYGTALLRYGPDGSFTGRMGSVDFSGVTRIAAGPSGGIYLLDPSNYKVHILSADGWLTASFGGYGTGHNFFSDLRSIGSDDEGNIYMLDAGEACVKVFYPNGKFKSEIARVSGKLERPVDMSVYGGRVAVLESKQENCILVYDKDGTVLETLPESGKVSYPWRIAAGSDGRVFLFDETPFLQYFSAGTPPSQRMKKKLGFVSGMAVDARGFLFIADSYRGVITEIIPDAMGSVKHTNKMFFPEPLDVAADALGNVYVLDGSTKRVVKLGR